MQANLIDLSDLVFMKSSLSHLFLDKQDDFSTICTYNTSSRPPMHIGPNDPVKRLLLSTIGCLQQRGHTGSFTASGLRNEAVAG